MLLSVDCFSHSSSEFPGTWHEDWSCFCFVLFFCVSCTFGILYPETVGHVYSSFHQAILLLQSRPETGECNLQCPLVQKVRALTPMVLLQLTPPQEHGAVVHPDSLPPSGCESMCSALRDLHHSHWGHFAHEPCGQWQERLGKTLTAIGTWGPKIKHFISTTAWSQVRSYFSKGEQLSSQDDRNLLQNSKEHELQTEVLSVSDTTSTIGSDGSHGSWKKTACLAASVFHTLVFIWSLLYNCHLYTKLGKLASLAHYNNMVSKIQWFLLGCVFLLDL